MKFLSLAIIVSSISFSSVASSFSQVANPSPAKFFCAKLKGNYYTFVDTEQGVLKILNFPSKLSKSRQEKIQLCINTSQRFQYFYDRQALKFIGAAEVNNKPVLCAIASIGDLCQTDNLLLSLPRTTNPVDAARQLMDLINLDSNVGMVEVKKGQLETYIDQTAYYDLEFFKQLIIDGKNTSFLIQQELTPIQNH